MNDLETKFGKKLPYNESKEYIDSLVDKCIDNAVAGDMPTMHSQFKKRLMLSTAIAAAIAGGVLFTFPLSDSSTSLSSSQNKTIQAVNNARPLDDVLSSLNDEQLQELSDYTLDDIPEY